MMLGTRTKMGSRVPTWLLGKSGFLNVQLQMEQTGAALHTKRIYKSKPITVFLNTTTYKDWIEITKDNLPEKTVDTATKSCDLTGTVLSMQRGELTDE